MGITFYIYRAENEKSLSPDTSSTDVKSFFSNCNVAALRQLGGGRVLLDLCLSLPEFSKIITPQPSSSLISLTSSRWALQSVLFSSLFCYSLLQSHSKPVILFRDKIIKPQPFVKCFSLRIQHKFIRLFEHIVSIAVLKFFFTLIKKQSSACTTDQILHPIDMYVYCFSYSVQGLSSELLVVSSIISIPILEPLSASRVEKVCQLALGCLDVALTIATGNFNIAGAAGKHKYMCIYTINFRINIWQASDLVTMIM